MIEDIKTLKQYVERERKSAQATMDEWLVKAGNNPSYALSWSLAAFEAAATLAVAGEVSDALGGEVATLESVKDYAHDKVARGALYVESSTSVPSNLMERCTLSSWAELYRQITRGL